MSAHPSDSPLTFGLCLPNFRAGASREGMEAAVGTAERLGWSTVWTTDHLLPDHSARGADYAVLFEAVSTLAWVAGINRTVGIGLSVLVVPMRNAAEQARTLATIDNLSGGRLSVGVGIGWSTVEYGNTGLADRYHVRGAYLDEAIRLWRHLWSGSQEPFTGRFTSFEEFRFAPLPAQGADVPILVGGRDERALRRAGALAEGYHCSAVGPDDLAGLVPVVRAAAQQAGRPEPRFQARCQVLFDRPAQGSFALAGSSEQMRAEVVRFNDLGVSHITVDLRENDPDRVVAAMERFDREVVAPTTR
jgi:probable F420-dependent oxidoreductase